MAWQKKKNLLKKKPELFNAVKYTNIAIQMAVIIGIGTYAGISLDAYFEFELVCTVILSLLSVFAAIYIVIKDFIQQNKDD